MISEVYLDLNQSLQKIFRCWPEIVFGPTSENLLKTLVRSPIGLPLWFKSKRLRMNFGNHRKSSGQPRKSLKILETLEIFVGVRVNFGIHPEDELKISSAILILLSIL